MGVGIGAGETEARPVRHTGINLNCLHQCCHFNLSSIAAFGGPKSATKLRSLYACFPLERTSVPAAARQRRFLQGWGRTRPRRTRPAATKRHRTHVGAQRTDRITGDENAECQYETSLRGHAPATVANIGAMNAYESA